jgi:hypothetical protein
VYTNLQLILETFILLSQCETVFNRIADRVDVTLRYQVLAGADVTVGSVIILILPFVLYGKMITKFQSIYK